MKEEMARTTQREKTMQALYQVFLYIENKMDVDSTALLCQQFHVENYEDIPAFSQLIYGLSLEHIGEIEKCIQNYLVGWAFSRLDNVAKAILVMAVAEGNYTRLTPRKVVISQAINLAKNYLEKDQHRFINAVLDKAIREDEPQQ